jgi:hypothetical protein
VVDAGRVIVSTAWRLHLARGGHSVTRRGAGCDRADQRDSRSCSPLARSDLRGAGSGRVMVPLRTTGFRQGPRRDGRGDDRPDVGVARRCRGIWTAPSGPSSTRRWLTSGPPVFFQVSISVEATPQTSRASLPRPLVRSFPARERPPPASPHLPRIPALVGTAGGKIVRRSSVSQPEPASREGSRDRTGGEEGRGVFLEAVPMMYGWRAAERSVCLSGPDDRGSCCAGVPDVGHEVRLNMGDNRRAAWAIERDDHL